VINFRFHVVSIVAVFLALALGVVMGSTVIDRAIVASLRSRIDRVEANADAQRAENRALRGELDARARYVASSAPFAVTGRLTGISLAVVAEPAVSDDALNNLIDLGRHSGAAVGGVLRVTDAWYDDARIDALRQAAGVEAKGPRATRDAAWSVLAERLASGVAADPQSDPLARLVDAGFLRYRSVDGSPTPPPAFPSAWPGAGARVLYATHSLPGPVAPQAQRVAAHAEAFAARGVPTVVADEHIDADGAPERGAILANARDDEQLRARISTVDDLELVDGRVATLLAAADLGRGVNGRFGYGAGVSGPVPEWWAP
jgi:hypothetical protein